MLLINISNPGIKIENPRVFEKLGKIEYVLAAKTGILTDENLKVQAFLIRNQAYVEKYNRLFEDTSFQEKNENAVIDVEEGAKMQESEPKLFEDLLQETMAEQVKSEE